MISRIMIIIGIALFLVAGGVFAYNQIYDYRAGNRAQELLDQMMAEFDWDMPPLSEMVYTPAASASPEDQGNTDAQAGSPRAARALGEEEPDAYDGSSRAHEPPPSSEASSGGGSVWTPPSYSVIGVLSMPQLGVRLPVIGEVSDALLKISACRISGGIDGKPKRLVIAGHNIKSHFKGLESYSIGDEIAFTTRDGDTYHYRMTEISALHKSEGADVLASDGWDLTLLTCKSDRTMRTMLRFVEITD